MRRRWVLATIVCSVLLLGSAGRASAQGELLYRKYCASCHGMEGGGDGPVAPSLTPRPTDLRTLTMPVDDLMRAIDGRRTIRAHGDATMPVWGHVLEREKRGRPHPGRATLYEVQALAEYVRTMRVRR